MKRHKIGLKSAFIYLLGVGLVALTVLNVTLFSSASRQESVIDVANKTRFIEVTGTTSGGNHIEVSLTNTSNKEITAYVLSLGENLTVKDDFIYSEADKTIKPAEGFVCKIPIPASLKGRDDKRITILAAVFDDKTGDGDQKVIGEIRDERLGEKIQLTRILPVLDGILSLPDSDSALRGRLSQEIVTALDRPEAETLEMLKKDAAQMEARTGRQTVTVREEIKSGLQTGKENILRKVEEINRRRQSEGDLNVKEEVSRLRRHYEKVLARL
ncbi:MAG TPA: hypothetical protein VKA70_19635 [Blastocatellia bacterium]|nr:hypothetical protein [Blastocatellia bacterium]